ncbi:MAG TPA: VOC family protein [Allosphingosinicella sp.]|jgi:catechol 2,3-dioxygenase-like lactoylglutathione lyase family enzyme
MKVKGISWLGVGTDRFEETLRFFTDVLGLPVVARGGEVAMLRAGEDQVVEIFGPGSPTSRLTSPPVASFEVEDVAAARAELEGHGVELIGETGAWNGFEWQYFRGPDGHVYAVKKTPPPGWETQ